MVGNFNRKINESICWFLEWSFIQSSNTKRDDDSTRYQWLSRNQHS
jgi:hypothetical protein